MSHLRQGIFLCLTACMAFMLTACGGDSGSSSSTPNTGDPSPAATGIALPDEISAISDSDAAAPAGMSVNLLALSRAANDLPSTSDYASYQTAKYVDEPALEVFGIIETILKAMKQTHYADEAVVNQGPYRAMVTWEDNEGGAQGSKTIEEWTVDSTMILENGEDVNVINAWIDEDHGTVKVVSKIYEAPIQDAEGNYTTYGKWEISADFGMGAFFADADVNEAGEVVLRISETMTDNFGGNEMTSNTRAIMIKSTEAGYGVVRVPNFEACWTPGACDGLDEVPAIEGKYAYNGSYLGLDPLGSGAIYKDRDNKVEFVYEYGVFDGTTGNDVSKDYSFGFPVKFTNGEGNEQYGYYGAWQGRHQLWAGNDNGLADGTTVTQADVQEDQIAETYTVANIPGTFLKEEIAPASIEQITGQPFETWISYGFELIYDDIGEGLQWYRCAERVWDEAKLDLVCSNHRPVDTGLFVEDSTGRKEVHLNRWVNNLGGFSEKMYDYNGSIFVENNMSSSPGTVYTPEQGDMMYAWVGGSVYVEFDGTNWVQKKLLSFDEQNWEPEFSENPADEVPFTFNEGESYQLHGKGFSYFVEKTSLGFDVKSVGWIAINPVNVTELGLDQISYLRSPWNDNGDTYEFISDPTDPAFLTMVYKSVGLGNNANNGDFVAKGEWSLEAYNANDELIVDGEGNPVKFNWEAATEHNPWAAMSYLVNASDQFVILDDPISFEPIDLTAYNGDTYGLKLSYDGWMHGLPDVRHELAKNDYDITNSVLGKLVMIPEGTALTQVDTGNTFYVKPLEVGVVLAPITAGEITGAGGTVPDLTAADSLDLNTVPVPTGNSLGAKPTDTELLYVEGEAVE